MSEEELIEYVAGHTGQSRRKFLERLLVGAAFATPVIASFSIGGASPARRAKVDAADHENGGNTHDCGPGFYFDDKSGMCLSICPQGYVYDLGSNTCVLDGGSNTPECEPGSSWDSGSNTCVIDEGSNTTSTTVAPTTTTTEAPTTTTTAPPVTTTTTDLGSGGGAVTTTTSAGSGAGTPGAIPDTE